MSDTGGINLAVRDTRSLASSDLPAAAVHSEEHVQLIRLLFQLHANMLPLVWEETGFTWILWNLCQLEESCLQRNYQISQRQKDDNVLIILHEFLHIIYKV